MNITLINRTLDSANYLGCFACGKKVRKTLPLCQENQELEGWVYKGATCLEQIPPSKIQLGLKGELQPRELTDMISKLGQQQLIARYLPQAEKKLVLFSSLPEGMT